MGQNSQDFTALTYKVGKEGLKINGTPTAKGTTTTAPNSWPQSVLLAHLSAGDIYLVTPTGHTQARSSTVAKTSQVIKPRGNVEATRMQPHDATGLPAAIPSDQA